MNPTTRETIDIETSARKELSKAFLELCNTVHRSPETVFDHFLEFVILGWCVNGKPLIGWPYDEEGNKAFQMLMQKWMQCLQKILSVREWYDLLGFLYETHVAGILRKSGRGQFFTPMHVCDLMAKVLEGDRESEGKASDPCCGSGRLLLARHATHPKDILVANDLDITCAMMTVCNFLVHGCVGVVTCGNALIPEDKPETWYVNPNLNDRTSVFFGLPHIVLETYEKEK